MTRIRDQGLLLDIVPYPKENGHPTKLLLSSRPVMCVGYTPQRTFISFGFVTISRDLAISYG